MKRKIFLTGATGFVGSHLLGGLIKEDGVDLYVLSRDPERLGWLKNKGVTVIKGDITEPDSMRGYLVGAEVVIHCAALMSNFDKEPASRFHEVNVIGTRNLLESCDRNTLRQFIHVSTAGVYGGTSAEPCDERKPYGKCLSIYERSKKEAEEVVFTCATARGIPFTVLRPSQMYGSGMRYGWPETIKSIRSGNMVVPGKGRAAIHLLNIKDLVSAVGLVLNNRVTINKIYNVAGPEVCSLKEIFTLIADIMNVRRPINIPYLPVYMASLLMNAVPCSMKSGKMRLLTPHRISFFAEDHAYDISRAKDEFHYNPRVSLRDGFREMITWCEQEGLM